MAKLLSRDTILHCIQEILHRILDPSLLHIEQGQNLSKALNVLMIKLLDNCNRNQTFRYIAKIAFVFV